MICLGNANLARIKPRQVELIFDDPQKACPQVIKSGSSGLKLFHIREHVQLSEILTNEKKGEKEDYLAVE